MKHLVYKLFPLIAVALSSYAETGRTTFIPQQIPFTSGLPLYINLDRPRHLFERPCNHNVSLHVTFFGGRNFDYSSPEADSIIDYLGPNPTSNNPHCLKFVEYKPDANDQLADFGKNVEARNFNIVTNPESSTTFQSEVCFKPRQQLFGAGIIYTQGFGRVDEENGSWPRWWFEASTAVVHMKNSMGMCERIIDDGGGAAEGEGLNGAPFVDSVTAAFNQKSWKYGKIPGGWIEKTGLSDIELKIGRTGVFCEACSLSSYVGVILPTSNKPDGVYMFQPLIGNNHHFGAMFGSVMSFSLSHKDSHRLRMFMDMNMRYLVPNHQVRSFDLKNKPWSRYMEVYENYEQALQAELNNDQNSGTAGINVFTKPVLVRPRFMTSTTTGWVFEWRKFVLEAGYSAYVRQAEEVEICNWNEDVVIKDINGNGKSNTARTIAENYPASFIPLANYRKISVEDLEPDSAARPASLSNIVYGAAGYNTCICGTSVLFGLGSSYEWGKDNTSIDRLLVWGSFAVTF